MITTEMLRKIEESSGAWSIEDAKSIVCYLGGNLEVVDTAVNYCSEAVRGNKRADCMVLMYCVALLAVKLEQQIKEPLPVITR